VTGVKWTVSHKTVPETSVSHKIVLETDVFHKTDTVLVTGLRRTVLFY